MLSGSYWVDGVSNRLSSLQSMLCKQEKKKKSSSYQPDFEEYSFLRVDLAENKAKMHSFNVHIHSMLNWINYSTVLPLC